MTKQIKILGAGIAGLVSAISLKNFDKNIDVSIYEKKRDVGLSHNNDFQQIENWVSNQDIVERVKQHFGIDLSPSIIKPVYSMACYSPKGKKFNLESETPFFYTVRRNNVDSLDDLLRQYALDKNVKIFFNSSLRETDVDIVATGAKKVQGVACGYKFKTDLKDGVYGFLDDDIAPKDYAYLVSIDGEATLAAVLFGEFKNIKNLRMKAFSRFKELLGDFKADNLSKFSGYDSYLHAAKRQKKGRLYIGAAGGFQDVLFGFGIKQAIISGYLSAQSIYEDKDFDCLWKNELEKEHKNEIVLRRLYDLLGNKGYELMIHSLSLIQKFVDIDIKKFMKFAYGSKIVRNPIFYKHAENYMLKKYNNTLSLDYQ